jgi:GAF domain-containing protein
LADHEVLFDVLRRFARKMTVSYDVSEVLYEFCDHAVDVLDADGAGVSLFDERGELRFAAATSQAVVAAEKAQEEGQAGPCISSVEERRPVAVSDIREHADRWPGYCLTIQDHGLTAVLGLPLVLEDERIGSVNVYGEGPRVWTDEQITFGTVLADIAAAYVYNASELVRSRRTAEQLQTALDTRVVIEQAKGIISAQRGMSMDQAFAAIRGHARSHGITVRSVAQAVVADGSSVIKER